MLATGATVTQEKTEGSLWQGDLASENLETEARDLKSFRFTRPGFLTLSPLLEVPFVRKGE
jgi:hypothetical protein